jgi:hypothetical protein
MAPSLIGTGLSTAASGAMGTPEQKITTPGNIPPMADASDPFSILKQIQSMKKGGGM